MNYPEASSMVEAFDCINDVVVLRTLFVVEFKAEVTLV